MTFEKKQKLIHKIITMTFKIILNFFRNKIFQIKLIFFVLVNETEMTERKITVTYMFRKALQKKINQ